MQDRVSLHPGRVKLTPVAGEANTFDLVRADQPTQEGTPLNKATLLKDTTAAILGLPKTAVPDDAFLALALPAGKYAISVTLKSPGGRPMSGVSLPGIVTTAGSTVVTDENGVGFGYSTSSPTTITADISAFLDLTGTASVTLTPQEKLVNQVEIVCTRGSSAQATFSASKTVRFSPDVSEYDWSAVGGGTDGTTGHMDEIVSNRIYRVTYAGDGGNGGGVINTESVPCNNDDIIIIVGGKGGKSSLNGVMTPDGSSGGLGGIDNSDYPQVSYRKPGDGVNVNSTFLYPPTKIGGSGGGGMAYGQGSQTRTGNGGKGGLDGGGAGGAVALDDDHMPIAARLDGASGVYPGSGGGGGGCTYLKNYVGNPGSGKPGLVGIVWRYK